MPTHKQLALLVVAAALLLKAGPALGSTITETFNTDDSNWLTVDSTEPVYHSTGGVGNSGYISNSRSFTSNSSGPFGAPPLQIMFRGNNSADASSDAFVGDWLSAGAQSLNVSVRHNYDSALNFYARLDAGSGAAASLAFSPSFAIEPNTWTTVTIPLTDSNPPFLSYGAGSFNGVFSNMQNLQFGLYVPASTTFTDLRMDLDNVVRAVPEPGTLSLVGIGLATLALWRRRRRG